MSSTSSITPLSSLTEDMRDDSVGLKCLMSRSLLDLSSPVRVSDSEQKSAEEPETLAAMTTSLVSWGIHWQLPVLIITYALCGLAGAIGHHLYYHFMDKSVVSSTETQQWALRFGTAFSVFTITMLRAAAVAAYNQYIWKVFRDKSFSIADLDKIFSLTSDFTGFFSLSLFKNGRLVILLASLCWLLPLAGLTPTATLSVVTSLHSETMNQSIPTLDFSSASWENTTLQEDVDSMFQMSLISENMVLPQLIAPAVNSSYTVQFYGPTIQCDEANTSDQAVFNQYSMALWNESEIFTSLTFQMFSDGDPGLLNASGLTSEGPRGSYSFLLASIFNLTTLDVDIPNSLYDALFWQFWVQTANSSIVCSCANASFEVNIDYLNGVQSISQGKIETVNILNYSIVNSSQTLDIPELGVTYWSIFSVVESLIVGTYSVGAADGDMSHFENTGLISCDEIYWWLNPHNYNNTLLGANTTVLSPADMDLPAEYSLCRNRTLSLAIQDLANNITISFLSNPNMTVNASIPVTITTPQNIYRYDSRNLVISYSTGVAAATFAMIVGLMAIHSNGVCHSTSFSAVMTSTIGNRQMSELTKGHSLGAKPLSRKLAEKKLRLGFLTRPDSEKTEWDEWGDPVGRIGFGLEGTVTKLRKGGICL